MCIRDRLWLGTFHSIAARILRRHAEVVGLKPNFTILDTDDQLRLLKPVSYTHLDVYKRQRGNSGSCR